MNHKIIKKILNQTNDATLIAASKKQTTQKIQELKKLGIHHFGENYLQELQKKHSEGAYEGCHIHFIGHIQSKKCADIVKIADTIHSVDRMKLIHTIEKACIAYNKAIDIFIQVNLSGETSKDGCLESELPPLIQHARETAPHVNIIGLMTFPPKGQGKAFYKRLKNLAEQHNLSKLSMGTSDDYLEAIEEGATHIRLGTTLFGERS